VSTFALEVWGVHMGGFSSVVQPVGDALLDMAAGHADLVKVSAEDLGMLWPGEATADIAAAWIAGGAALVW
jgi:hypothetical protein